MIRDPDVAAPGPHAPEPGADARKSGEFEATLLRNVRVSVQGDVRDRVALADEKVAGGEVLLHDAERMITAIDLLRERLAILLDETGDMPESDDGDIHCSTFARSHRSSGKNSVPSARYQRMASDSASRRPSGHSRRRTR